MRSWRFFTWVILVVQALFILWMAYALFSTSDDCTGLSGNLADACKAGAAIGLGVGFVVILFVWSLVDIILGVIWVVTNKWTVEDRHRSLTRDSLLIPQSTVAAVSRPAPPEPLEPELPPLGSGNSPADFLVRHLRQSEEVTDNRREAPGLGDSLFPDGR